MCTSLYTASLSFQGDEEQYESIFEDHFLTPAESPIYLISHSKGPLLDQDLILFAIYEGTIHQFDLAASRQSFSMFYLYAA